MSKQRILLVSVAIMMASLGSSQVLAANTVASAWEKSEGVAYVDEKVGDLKTDMVEITNNQQVQISVNRGDINKNKDAIAENSGRLDIVETQVSDNTTKITNNGLRLDTVETQVSDNTNAIADVKTDVNGVKAGVADNTAAIEANKTATDQKFVDERAATTQQFKDERVVTTNHVNDMFSSQQAITDQRFMQVDSRIDRLDSKVDKNRDRSNAGIAGVAAMANIPYVDGHRFSFGMGIGHHRNQQALAIGVNAAIKDNTHLRLSVATNTEQEQTIGAGLAFGF